MVIIGDTSVERGDTPNCQAVVPNLALPCLIMSGFMVQSMRFPLRAGYRFCFKWHTFPEISSNFVLHIRCQVAKSEQISLWTWAVVRSKCDNTWSRHNNFICNRSGWYSQLSPVRETCMFCIQTHSTIIHSRTVNMNWWVLNCEACCPAQNSISHRYLILSFITKSSKRLNGGK